MALKFQVTFDCHDPAGLGEFWAAALGYVREAPPDGFDDWESWLREHNVPEEDWNKANAVVDPDGEGPRLFFQRVPEEKTVKNRVHLDVRASDLSVPRDERLPLRDKKVAELEHLGATRLAEYDELGTAWVVMQDPEGNEFCVS